MILEAVRRTYENGIRQHAGENVSTKMDEAIEIDRETIETDDNWQTVTNQRSNKVQKTNSHAPVTTMSFFGQKVPQDSKTDGFHSHFSFGGNDTRSNPIFCQEKSSLMQQPELAGASSTYVRGRRKKKKIYHRSKWNSKLNRNQWTSKCSMI